MDLGRTRESPPSGNRGNIKCKLNFPQFHGIPSLNVCKMSTFFNRNVLCESRWNETFNEALQK